MRLAHLSTTLLLSACAAHTPPIPPTPPPAAADAGVDAAPHGEGGSHGGGHGHGPGHFADPGRFVPQWNDPERDTWQKPAEIIAAADIGAGDTVVDLGAGTGYLLPPLAAAVSPGGQVIALDIEPAMLAFLDEAAAREGWSSVRTHQGAPDDPRLPAESVDAVVTLNVWHHVENRSAYAGRLLHAIRPGGTFVIVDFLKEQTEGFGPPLDMRLRAEDVVAELQAGGFEAEIVSESLPRHYIVRGRRPAAR